MTSRRWPHPGRHLKAIDARPLVDGDDELRELNARLEARGFRLKAEVRPYLTLSNAMTFVFVWRRRGEWGSSTYTVTWRLAPAIWREAVNA